MNTANFVEIEKFIYLIADLAKDGDCEIHGDSENCGGNRKDCVVFVQEHLDAFDTLTALIDKARAILRKKESDSG